MKKILVGIVVLLSLGASAHPVSFEGSKGIMGYHSPLLTHAQFNYSFRHWFAVGLHHFDVPNTNANQFANFLSANFLLHRWNGAGFQANIYTVLGAGHSKLNQESIGAGLAKLQFDIEDRDYYFLTYYSQVQSESRTELRDFTVRAGLSPYVGKFDDIHSWLILEYRSQEILDNGAFEDVTPFLRLFYKNLLFEIGQSFNGLTRFNYIVHF